MVLECVVRFVAWVGWCLVLLVCLRWLFGLVVGVILCYGLWDGRLGGFEVALDLWCGFGVCLFCFVLCFVFCCFFVLF